MVFNGRIAEMFCATQKEKKVEKVNELLTNFLLISNLQLLLSPYISCLITDCPFDLLKVSFVFK